MRAVTLIVGLLHHDAQKKNALKIIVSNMPDAHTASQIAKSIKSIDDQFNYEFVIKCINSKCLNEVIDFYVKNSMESKLKGLYSFDAYINNRRNIICLLHFIEILQSIG